MPIFTSWMQILTSALLFALTLAMGYTIKVFFDIRLRVVALEMKQSETDKACEDHLKNESELFKLVHKVDKNVGRLCLKAGIQEVSAE